MRERLCDDLHTFKKGAQVATEMRGSMPVTEAKADLPFAEGGFVQARPLAGMVSKCCLICHEAGRTRLEELKKQAAHFDSTHYMVDDITEVQKRKSKYEKLIRWLGFDRDFEALGSRPEVYMRRGLVSYMTSCTLHWIKTWREKLSSQTFQWICCDIMFMAHSNYSLMCIDVLWPKYREQI